MSRPWRTANGRVIALEKMVTEHIRNAVNYMRDKGVKQLHPDFATIRDLLRELESREALTVDEAAWLKELERPPAKKPRQPKKTPEPEAPTVAAEVRRFAELEFEEDET